MSSGGKKGKKEEDFSFQVDLKGIIRLLSENLYSSADVFLRELLQNAVDAIAARRETEPDFKDGRIKITYHSQTDGQAGLTFSDNGIGLTREEIHTFLSVIGQSSKRGKMEQTSFIGQFGIGLLSCFLVADEIVVKSRSIREERGWQWLGRSDGTYQVTVGEEDFPAGTRVEIMLNKKMARRYPEERVTELLKEYGFLIRIPVEFEGDCGSRRINDGFIPWRQSFCSGEEILQFGELMFGEKFFGVVPILGEGLKGYAFISERQTSAATMGRHKIYLKDMLITEDGKELIPKWAFFTRCIVNAEYLTPMASREGFASDHALAKARNEIEKCLFDYFVSLSKYDVNKLKRLTMIHNVAIKSLAVENEQIYKLFFPFLAFSTNIGELTGLQLLEAAKRFPVYYCAEVDDFRRARPLVGNARVLINAGYIYDTKLLQLLRHYFQGVRIEMFDEASYAELLEEPSESIKREMAYMVAAATQTLEKFRCGVMLRQFEPTDAPALYVAGADGFLDSAFLDSGPSGFLEGFDFGDAGGYGNKLYLNAANPLIQQLAQVQEPEMMEDMVEVLYIHAMLAGHYTLSGREMEILNTGLIKLMEYGLGGRI